MSITHQHNHLGIVEPSAVIESLLKLTEAGELTWKTDCSDYTTTHQGVEVSVGFRRMKKTGRLWVVIDGEWQRVATGSFILPLVKLVHEQHRRTSDVNIALAKLVA